MPVQITKHGADRLRERIGLSKKALQRAADTAFEKGVRHSETSGNLNKWVTGLFFSNPMANNIRLYNDKAWIFAGETLVTVIQVPASLKKSLKDAIDRKKTKGRTADAPDSEDRDTADSTDNTTIGEEGTE